MIERRKRPRVRVDSVAFIVSTSGNPVACRIKDRSEDGARLSVDSILGIPNRFRLVVQKTGDDLPATVVWRGPQEIGVAFVDTTIAPVATGTPIEIPLGAQLGYGAPEAGADGPFPLGAECEA